MTWHMSRVAAAASTTMRAMSTPCVAAVCMGMMAMAVMVVRHVAVSNMATACMHASAMLNIVALGRMADHLAALPFLQGQI